MNYKLNIATIYRFVINYILPYRAENFNYKIACRVFYVSYTGTFVKSYSKNIFHFGLLTYVFC